MENKKNTAASTPEMVTISRAEYEELKLQNQWLLEQLGLAKKRQFGASSERLEEGLMDQLSLMANEAEAYAYGTRNATAEQVAVKAHARKRQSGNVLDRQTAVPAETGQTGAPAQPALWRWCGGWCCD